MSSAPRAHEHDSSDGIRLSSGPQLSRRRAVPDNGIYTNGLSTSQSNESLLSHSSSFDDTLGSPTTPIKLGKRDSLPLSAADLSDGDDHDAFEEQNGKGTKLEGQESLAFLYAIITVYAFSYHMSFPIYPYMVSKFRGGDTREGQLAFGAFRSFNQTLQLIGSLLAGSLVDKIGCKNVILVSFAASVACYVLLALAWDLKTLYVSQLPALFQHVLLASRGFVSFAVPSDQRSISFGRLATSYGVGAIAGPAVGGLLGKYSFSLPAAVSAVTCLLAGLAVFYFLPDIHASAARQKEVKDNLLPPPTALSSYLSLLKDPKLTTILLMKLFFLLAVSLHSSTIQMVSGPVFGMDTAAAGGLMSFGAILGTVSQGVVVRPALAVFSPASLTLLAAAVLAPSYGTLGGLSAGWQLYLLAVPVSIANTIQNLVSAQVAVDLAPASGRGSYIGLEQALASGGRMVAPTVAGWVLKNGGLKGVGFACAGLVAGGVLAQVWGTRRKRGRSGREE